MEQVPRLVLYDGVCGLCDKSVQWLLENDPEGRLRFAPLQGDTAAEVMARHPEIPAGLDSIIYVEHDGERENVFWRSRAIFRLSLHLQTGWRALSWFRFVPSFLADLVYRLIAKMRYRFWGKLDTCRVPTPEERSRFLP